MLFYPQMFNAKDDAVNPIIVSQFYDLFSYYLITAGFQQIDNDQWICFGHIALRVRSTGQRLLIIRLDIRTAQLVVVTWKQYITLCLCRCVAQLLRSFSAIIPNSDQRRVIMHTTFLASNSAWNFKVHGHTRNKLLHTIFLK